MERFSIITGKVAHIPLSNIDTDMIIPKQFLKTIKRSGLGQFLFADSRYDISGQVIEDFILNQQPDSKILIVGENFGCGSSREHAPWALIDFGIRVIIAPSFADIFYNNCFKNGILPIKLMQTDIDALLKEGAEMTVDLAAQSIQCGNAQYYFSIDDHRKEILLEGLDDIEKVLKLKDEIASFEHRHHIHFPWLKENHNA